MAMDGGHLPAWDGSGCPDALPHVHRGRRRALEDDAGRATREIEGRRQIRN